ncbi:MAG: SRPBCC family protein [Candidatus Binataceae bacterium]
MTIRKSIKVARAPEVAFEVFTAKIGAWWPLKEGFTFGGERAQDVFMESREGGRFYERYSDGTEFEVGRVTAYEPPRLLVFTWRAPDWEAQTEVEIRFIPDGNGTRLELEHRGWELGAKISGRRDGYDGGWDTVLARYASSVDTNS